MIELAYANRDFPNTNPSPSSVDSDLYSKPLSIQVLSETSPYPNLRPIVLRVFSIINVMLWTICTVLEVSVMPSYGLGIWCSVFYMFNGFLGYSASYRPTRLLLVAVAIFSSLAIVSALLVSFLAALAQFSSLSCCNSGGFWSTWKFCEYLQFSLESFSVVALANNAVILSLVFRCLCCSHHQSSQKVITTTPASSINSTLSTNLDSTESLIV